MPVRQMKLRFDAAKPTARVVPSLLVPESSSGGARRGNKEAFGRAAAEPILGVAGVPPAADSPPPPGSG
ncbi:MAG: hypothetical protein ACM36B_01255 [Bacteroidota bacterium]